MHAVQDHFGRLDILVNNAGGGSNVPFLEISIEAWDAMIAKNLRSAFLCTRFALGGEHQRRAHETHYRNHQCSTLVMCSS